MRYQIRHAIVQYGAETILKDVNFEIRDHEKIAIVGRNGCGKTTLLKLIAGDLEMANIDSDESCGIDMAGEQKIGYLRQISFEDGEISVENEILKVFEPVFECERRMKELSELLEKDHNQDLMYEYSSLQDKMEALGGYSYRRDMEMMFYKFGFGPEDLKRPIGTFSGGQQTKVAFIKLLLSRPDIMLLDEPTNHLDLPTIEWLEGYLKNYNKAVVIVSHDRMFLDRIIDVTYEIEYGSMYRYVGNYSTFLKLRDERNAKLEKDYEEQQKEIARLTEWVEKWKNTPTKVTAARSKLKQIEHMVPIERPRRYDTKAFRAGFLPRTTSYTEVLNLKALQIGYDEVLSKVSFTLRKGECVAVIGENGKGKSTLLKTLMGQIPALGGTFDVGPGVEVGYFDQQAAVEESRNPEKTVIEDFWDLYPSLKEVEVRSDLGSFLFSGEEVFKTLGMLSGGEKVRLALCKMFKTRPNLLILDEPTNHMDIVGKEALESMLKDYTGTTLVVSHDRYFIREVATGILDFKADKVVYYNCGYEEYLERISKEEARVAKEETVTKTSSQNQGPTLSDVFDKKTYYNPGKIESRLKQQIAKYEKMLSESEEKLSEIRLKQEDPVLASDYEKLMELEKEGEAEEHNQESILERLLEAETELQELQENKA